MSAFWELYKHPEWQKKRLEILSRDGFACVNCDGLRGRDVELHVHHGYYSKGKKPWEYPSESLFTLCAVCHSESGDLRKQLLEELGHVTPMAYDHTLGALRVIRMDFGQEFLFDTDNIVSNYAVSAGLMRMFSLEPDTVLESDFAYFLMSEYTSVFSAHLPELFIDWLSVRGKPERNS